MKQGRGVRCEVSGARCQVSGASDQWLVISGQWFLKGSLSKNFFSPQEADR